MDRTRGKLGKGDMEGKRGGRERTRGCGTVGRGRKREQRAGHVSVIILGWN